MSSGRKQIWSVCRGPGAPAFPIADEKAAEAFRKVGWKVTEVALTAFEPGVECLGSAFRPPPESPR